MIFSVVAFQGLPLEGQLADTPEVKSETMIYLARVLLLRRLVPIIFRCWNL